MSQVVRSASLLAAVLALQIVVVCDGMVCAAAVRGVVRESDSVPAMDMPATPRMDTQPTSEPSMPNGAPCSPTDAPSPCKTLAPCAPVFVPPLVTVTPSPLAGASRDVPLIQRAPVSPALPPEPPPPRS